MTNYLQTAPIMNAPFLPKFLFILMLGTSHGESLHRRIDARPLQRANLEDSRAGSDGVVSHGGVAAGKHNVGLAGDWRRAVWCSGDGERKASINSGRSGHLLEEAVMMGWIVKTYGTKSGPVTVMKAP